MANTLRYKKEYCKDLVKHMAKGYSYSTFSVDLGVCVDTMYDWEKKYPEWATAKKEGYEAGKKHFETLLLVAGSGQRIKNSSGVNMTAVIFAMKTRFYKEYGDMSKHGPLSDTPPENNFTVQFVDPPSKKDEEQK